MLQTSEVEGEAEKMLQGIPGARMKWEQAQSVQETLMLYELREGQEARPMFDPRKDVQEHAEEYASCIEGAGSSSVP